MGAAPLGRSILEQSAPEELNLIVWTRIGRIFEELQSIGSPQWISLGEAASCRRGPTIEQLKRVKMGAPETKFYGLNTIPIPHSPAQLWWRGQKRVGGRKVFSVCFSFHYCSLL